MTTAAPEQVGIDDSITMWTDCGQIVSYAVMSTPALAIEGEVKTRRTRRKRRRDRRLDHIHQLR